MRAPGRASKCRCSANFNVSLSFPNSADECRSGTQLVKNVSAPLRTPTSAGLVGFFSCKWRTRSSTAHKFHVTTPQLDSVESPLFKKTNKNSYDVANAESFRNVSTWMESVDACVPLRENIQTAIHVSILASTYQTTTHLISNPLMQVCRRCSCEGADRQQSRYRGQRQTSLAQGKCTMRWVDEMGG